MASGKPNLVSPLCPKFEFNLFPFFRVGVDFSAAEAFVRIQRLLEGKGVVLVLCGCSCDSNVGLALQSVDLWTGGSEHAVEVFENQNDALEVSSFFIDQARWYPVSDMSFTLVLRELVPSKFVLQSVQRSSSR